MDYPKFDNDKDASDKNYFAFVEWLSALTVGELQQAKGNPEQQKLALCRYYKCGRRANLSAGELIDLLGVSSPSILGGDLLFELLYELIGNSSDAALR